MNPLEAFREHRQSFWLHYTAGDYPALRQRDRRVLGVNPGPDVGEGLTRLTDALGPGATVG